MLLQLLAEVCHEAAADVGCEFVGVADVIGTQAPTHGALYK